MSGPVRLPSRDLVRLVCPSCEDEVRVAADELRPECKRCAILLSEPGLCPRAHDFAVSEIRVKAKGRDLRCLIPTPSGFTEVPYYEDARS